MSTTTHTEQAYDKRYNDPQTLFDLYWTEGMGMEEMADELECSKSTIVNKMNEHGIERRDGGRKKLDVTELFRLVECGVSTVDGLAQRLDYGTESIERNLYHLRDGGFVDAEIDVNGQLQWEAIDE